jgi:predicted AAA+ superfamily ATPase
MKRTLIFELNAWAERMSRKPLIVLGARQVGKTYLLREFGRQKFSKVHEFNFQSTPTLLKIFSGDLQPKQLLRELEFVSNQSINRDGSELLFFDEIGECPGALTSLKYFCEELPGVPIVAAGSLLGLHLSSTPFPVGKVDILHLYPLSFVEFIEAAAHSREVSTLRDALYDPLSLPEVAHLRFWDLFKCYLITGGLPESVATWLEHGAFQGGQGAFTASRQKLSTLITAYSADIAKHSGKVNAMYIDRVWKSVPQQLASFFDDSTSRYKFKEVVPGIASYRDLAGPIDWLLKAGMALRTPVCHSAQSPISAYTKENIFKLYMFDCGVLGSMLAMPPGLIMDFSFGTYKGFFAENFVAQELPATLGSPRESLTNHAWSEGNAEIEFILDSDLGVIPIEVKSGSRIRAKSLLSFIERYNPPMSVVLSSRMPSETQSEKTKLINLPIYLASAIGEQIRKHASQRGVVQK